MAERVVVAEISIDETGAVRAIKNVQDSVGGTSRTFEGFDRQTLATSNAFTHRMFSMRSAAVAFLGGFTLAGVILGLKNLITEAVKSDVGFKSLAASAKVFHETIVDIIHDLPGFSTIVEHFGDIMLGFAAEFKVLFSGQGIKALMNDLLNDTDTFLKLFTAKLAQLKKERDNLVGGSFIHPDVLVSLNQWQALLQSDLVATREWVEAQREAKLVTEENLPLIETFKHRWLDTLRELKAQLKDTKIWTDLLSASLAVALTSGAEEGGLTFKKVLASMLEAVGQMLISLGSLLVVRGIFTYNGAEVGAGLIAIAAGLGAIAIAHKWGGTGSEAGGSGSRGISNAAPPQRAVQNITIVYEGGLIGVGQTADQFARQMVIPFQRALAAGAGGGSF